jgi:hypothetical protein
VTVEALAEEEAVFGFGTGKAHTLESFKRAADNFKA